MEILFYFGNVFFDLICMFFIGYGKSLIYELFLVLLREKFNKSVYLIVIELLNVIINL